MNYLLNIHTTTVKAIVNLSKEDKVVASVSNNDNKKHAAFLHTAIQNILQENDMSFSALKAVGVTGGPGSYTGIRVGMATAKGICYALGIPLILCNALEVMAHSAIKITKDNEGLYFPMIDARRMEVFTAVYDSNLKEIEPPSALVLEDEYFRKFLSKHRCYFFGNGSEKLKQSIVDSNNTFLINTEISPSSLSWICWEKYRQNDFVNVGSSQPLYIKDFYTATKIS